MAAGVRPKTTARERCDGALSDLRSTPFGSRLLEIYRDIPVQGGSQFSGLRVQLGRCGYMAGELGAAHKAYFWSEPNASWSWTYSKDE